MVLCSAYLDEELKERALAVGFEACLSKQEMHRIPAALHQDAAGSAG